MDRFSRKKKGRISNFIKIRPVGTELLRGRTYGQTWRRIAFSQFCERASNACGAKWTHCLPRTLFFESECLKILPWSCPGLRVCPPFVPVLTSVPALDGLGTKHPGWWLGKARTVGPSTVHHFIIAHSTSTHGSGWASYDRSRSLPCIA